MFIDRMRLLAVRVFAKAQLNLPLDYLQELLFMDDGKSVFLYLESAGYKNLQDVQAKLDDPIADAAKIYLPLKLAQSDIES